MKILTKYNLDDTVYFMEANKIQSGVIISIKLTLNKMPTVIHYAVEGSDTHRSFTESDIFSTKEDLIKSLLKHIS